jgi:hypothetical protein
MYTSDAPLSRGMGDGTQCADPVSFSFGEGFTPVCDGFSDQKISGILDLIAIPHCPERWGLEQGDLLFCVSCADQIDDAGSLTFSSSPTKKPRRIGCSGETVDVVMQENYSASFQLSNPRHRANLWGNMGRDVDVTSGEILSWAMSLTSRVGRDPRQDAVTIIAKGQDSGDPLIVFFSAYPMASDFQIKFGTDDFWRFPVAFSLQSVKIQNFNLGLSDGTTQTIDMSNAGTSFGLWGQLS